MIRTNFQNFHALLLCIGLSVIHQTLSAQQCNNEDFEFGNVSNWTGYTGKISHTGNIAINRLELVAGRHTITTGTDTDPIADLCGIDISQVERGGLFSLKLGNEQVGAEAERITQTFVVEPGKEFFLYKYAVVLEDPSHQPRQQPRFEVRVFDKDGNLAPCGVFKVRAGPNAANDGFQLCQNGYRKYWVKDWTVSGADLSNFVGEQVTIEFLTTDCALGGHAGYAYVEASCKSLDISLDGFCPSDPGYTSFEASVTQGFKSYVWSNGDTGNTTIFNNLSYGDQISVRVSTFTGCSTLFFKTLEAPPGFVMDPLQDETVCKNQPFTLSASGDGFGFVRWDHINSKEPTVVLTTPKDTLFSYEVYDLNGCPTGIRDTAYVTAVGMDIVSTVNQVTCNGIDDGSIEVMVSNGVPLYTFEWEDGSSGSFRDNLRPGDYNVVVRDQSGCFQELDFELLEPSLVTFDIKTDSSKCTIPDGRIEITNLGGGTPPYIVEWLDDPGNTDLVRENLFSGIYTLRITDDNGTGCVIDTEIAIFDPELFLNFERIDPHCFMDDGSIKAVVQGGSGSYTYSWSNGETSQMISGLTHGDYSVDVEDAWGCSISSTTSLRPAPDPLMIQVNKTDAVCSFADGSAEVIITGGEAPYLVQWSSGQSGMSASELLVGDHEVVITDFNDCSRSIAFTIDPPPPLLSVEVEVQDAVCNYHDGIAQLSISGGTTPYEIHWLNTGESSRLVDSLAVGIHPFEVTDANGCTWIGEAVVGPPDNLMELEVTSIGESYGLRNGTAEVQVTGGVAQYSYEWFPVGGNEPRANGLSTGDYIIRVTDGNGCTVQDSVFVEELPPIDIPNAFTPNGDAFNDFWEIINVLNYPQAHVKVFNRWGNLVFESDGYHQPWEGAGHPVDTYYYLIDLKIGLKPFTGYVDIIR